MADAGLDIVREFAAPPERVWAEWTTPEAFADWFGGDASEVPLDSVAMDVRPGGTWRATMFAGPERRELRWAGEYVEVQPPSRLVLTMTDDPGSEPRELLVVELTEIAGGGTRMRFTQRGGMTAEQYRAAQGGWGAFFAAMEARLAA